MLPTRRCCQWWVKARPLILITSWSVTAEWLSIPSTCCPRLVRGSGRLSTLDPPSWTTRVDPTPRSHSKTATTSLSGRRNDESSQVSKSGRWIRNTLRAWSMLTVVSYQIESCLSSLAGGKQNSSHFDEKIWENSIVAKILTSLWSRHYTSTLRSRSYAFWKLLYIISDYSFVKKQYLYQSTWALVII